MRNSLSSSDGHFLPVAEQQLSFCREVVYDDANDDIGFGSAAGSEELI